MIHHAHKCEMNIKINRDLKRSITYQEINKIQINSVNYFISMCTRDILPG